MSAGRKPAGRTDTQTVVLPSERHCELLALLRANSHRDRAGRLVSYWGQAQLAAKLCVSVRTLQNVLADLREPGTDPRHPIERGPGLRLGLVKVEPTRREPVVGGRVFGGNLYVLSEPLRVGVTSDDTQTRRSHRSATKKPALTSDDAVSVACRNKSLEPDHSPVGGTTPADGDQGEALRVGAEVWPAYADSRYYSGPGRRATTVEREHADPPVQLHVAKRDQLDHQPKGADEILGILRAGLGDVEVLEAWKHPTYATARGRVIDLETCSVDDLHQALDQLERHTCSNGDRCEGNHRCKRHTPRRRAR